MAYADTYFYLHDTHAIDTVTNVIKDTFGVAVFTDYDGRTVTVRGAVDYHDLHAVATITGCVHDVDYGIDYDYDDNL